MKFSNFIYKTLFIVLLFWSDLVFGQYNLRPNIVHFSRQSYKASEKNWAVDIDRSGFIYFGNNSGLLQFDGERWELFQLPEKTIIRSVKVSADDKIYTGAYEEFGYWQRDQYGILNYTSLSEGIASEMHNDEIWKIAFDEDKVIFQSFNNLYVWDGTTVKMVPDTPFLLFLQKANDQLFIQGISSGIFSMANDSLLRIDGSQLFDDKNVRTILPYSSTEVLMCSALSGIYKYDGHKFSYWDSPISEQLKGADVNTGLVINDDLFAIGTLFRGIFIFNKKGDVVRQINVEDELGSNTIYDINIDPDGNLWVGMDKGISFIKFDTPVKLFVDKTVSMGLVYDVCEFNQQLYIGTNRGLFTTKIDANFPESFNFSQLQAIDELAGQVWNIEVIDNFVFCEHSNGTYLLNGNRAKKISDYNGALKMKEFEYNGERLILQSTYANLVLYKKDSVSRQWFPSHRIEGFHEPSKNFEIDEFGNIWVSHLQKGIYKLTLSNDLKSVQSQTYFNKDSGLPAEHNVNVFKVKNRIVFTTGAGLYAYDNLKNEIVPFDLYNVQLGEFKNAKSIFPASNHSYWFLLNEIAALYEITNDSMRQQKQISFDFADAVLVEYYEQISQVTPLYSIACLTNGIGVIATGKEENGKNQHGPTITNIEVFDKNNSARFLPLRSNDKVHVQPTENRLSLEFTAFNYHEGGIVYKTKLSGIDADWIISTVPMRTFERLPQGQYTFELGMVTANGSDQPSVSYRFTVLPPWYYTRLAYIMYVIFIISIVVFVRIYMVLKLKKHIDVVRHDQQLELENEQRLHHQRIVELENEKLQTEIEFKSQQLAAMTMTTINKNEILSAIKKVIDIQMDELGSRFPKKNYLEIVNAIDKFLSDDDWATFESNFDRAHQDFFNRLKQQFPDLTPGDIKLCAYLKMNLASKEIAHLLNISIRSVEVHRYRIRKKLNLAPVENLVEYLMAF
ncbi:MAG: two-component regulator propeller domain-containing protein [Prolixibacteraceae bacterium]